MTMKVAGQLNVGHLQNVEVLPELVGDGGDGNVADIDLVFLDEVEEQVQGPMKLGQVDAVVHPWLAGE